ncbi:hotdog fold thioesterase [Marinobacter adhaerens]|uniref:Hotdog fold thioesterase n=1 Tax=Marinobacter adhaerens TaxID=1033846 RepID=A0A851HSK8_9GAMM|nr:hotdog fold thioesterase [Marinobacter adhaerens]NWN90272.1 hotdog fold thioesterase [Marinobacter adhaerens]
MKHPFAKLIGLEVDSTEAGVSTCSIAITETLLNPHKVAHGAVLYALADTGMGAALYPLLAEGELCATIEIKINYYAPVYEGQVSCVTRVINTGKSVVNLESEIFSGERLVAKANGNYARFTPGARRDQTQQRKENSMNAVSEAYPIGTPGTPWGDEERAEWLSRQSRQRSYETDVLSVIERLRPRFDVEQYGRLDYGSESYPLMAIRSRNWRDDLPVVLVTGGVHGYETSGVHGALQFVDQHAEEYVGRVNLLVAPCVSPWAYERIHRWNPNAIDPNRSFHEDSPAEESAALMRLVAPIRDHALVHIDLHETTDTDESEFRPALAARDGKPLEPGGIPDGFYLVDDSENPRPEFQRAIIEAVEAVTHIAPADANGELIGSPEVARGVIQYPLRQLGLCAGITNASYRTTTEVYPDSPRVTPAQCNAAQVVAVCAAIRYALKHP